MTSSYVNTTNPLLPNIEAIKMTNKEYKNLLHILGDKDIEEIFSKHNNIFSTTKELQELIGRKQNLLSEVERQQSFQIVMSKYKDRFIENLENEVSKLKEELEKITNLEEYEQITQGLDLINIIKTFIADNFSDFLTLLNSDEKLIEQHKNLFMKLLKGYYDENDIEHRINGKLILEEFIKQLNILIGILEPTDNNDKIKAVYGDYDIIENLLCTANNIPDIKFEGPNLIIDGILYTKLTNNVNINGIYSKGKVPKMKELLHNKIFFQTGTMMTAGTIPSPLKSFSSLELDINDTQSTNNHPSNVSTETQNLSTISESVNDDPVSKKPGIISRFFSTFSRSNKYKTEKHDEEHQPILKKSTRDFTGVFTGDSSQLSTYKDTTPIRNLTPSKLYGKYSPDSSIKAADYTADFGRVNAINLQPNLSVYKKCQININYNIVIIFKLTKVISDNKYIVVPYYNIKMLLNSDKLFKSSRDSLKRDLIKCIYEDLVHLKLIDDRSFSIIINGGKNKKVQYKLTAKKVTILYKNKKIIRNIYLKKKIAYCKINKEFILLSKLKKLS